MCVLAEYRSAGHEKERTIWFQMQSRSRGTSRHSVTQERERRRLLMTRAWNVRSFQDVDVIVLQSHDVFVGHRTYNIFFLSKQEVIPKAVATTIFTLHIE